MQWRKRRRSLLQVRMIQYQFSKTSTLRDRVWIPRSLKDGWRRFGVTEDNGGASEMICLDTSYLIRALLPGSAEAAEIVKWSRAGETLVTAMPCWFEFLCGPATPIQIAAIRRLLREIVPFGEDQAIEAARLLNAVGRRRTLRVDSMIAGTASVAGAHLATANRLDFEPFARYGLALL